VNFEDLEDLDPLPVRAEGTLPDIVLLPVNFTQVRHGPSALFPFSFLSPNIFGKVLRIAISVSATEF
jgi:hypothetical protein